MTKQTRTANFSFVIYRRWGHIYGVFLLIQQSLVLNEPSYCRGSGACTYIKGDKLYDISNVKEDIMLT